MTDDNDIPKPDIRDDVALELGRFIAAFNWVEWILTALLERLTESKGPLDVLVGQMMFRSILDATKNMVAFVCGPQSGDMATRLNATLKKLDALNERRNDLVHGAWLPDEILGFYALAKRKRDGTGKFTPMNAAEIRKTKEELELVAQELQSLTAEYARMTT